MAKDYIIVFEDEYYPRFYPLSLSRPIYNILAGCKTNLERIKHYFSDFEILTFCRPYLSEIFGKGKIEELITTQFNKLILINGRVVFCLDDLEFINELKNKNPSVAYIKDDTLIACVLSSKNIKDFSSDISSFYCKGISKKIIESLNKVEQVDTLTFSYIWEVVLLNPKLIERDFNEYFKDKNLQNPIGDSFIYEKSQISSYGNVSADFASVIDARGGPVIIGREVKIEPFTYLAGPAFIGDGCKLVGGKITNGCSLGKGCRIGGEVENTIVIGNSNKYHTGFIGHSYIGEWVNLGALTTNSDLKNNYSEISIKQNGIMTKTGSIKIGCFIGDHTKTGIGTTLNTGVIINFSCNLFGGGLIKKNIPSFAWGNDTLRKTFSLEDAVETAKIVLKRRNFIFDDKYYRLFEHIFNQETLEREIWLNK